MRHDNSLNPSTSLRMTRCKALHFGGLSELEATRNKSGVTTQDLLHETFDVGDGACDALLEVPNAGEGLAVAFEDNAVIQDEDLA